jgi:hypothetical protein
LPSPYIRQKLEIRSFKSRWQVASETANNYKISMQKKYVFNAVIERKKLLLEWIDFTEKF